MSPTVLDILISRPILSNAVRALFRVSARLKAVFASTVLRDISDIILIATKDIIVVATKSDTSDEPPCPRCILFMFIYPVRPRRLSKPDIVKVLGLPCEVRKLMVTVARSDSVPKGSIVKLIVFVIAPLASQVRRTDCV